MALELEVPLADEVVEDVVGPLDGHLDLAPGPVLAGGRRPGGPDGVVDEGVVLPGQGQLYLHLVLTVLGHRVDRVALPQPTGQDGGKVGVDSHLHLLLVDQVLLAGGDEKRVAYLGKYSSPSEILLILDERSDFNSLQNFSVKCNLYQTFARRASLVENIL